MKSSDMCLWNWYILKKNMLIWKVLFDDSVITFDEIRSTPDNLSIDSINKIDYIFAITAKNVG